MQQVEPATLTPEQQIAAERMRRFAGKVSDAMDPCGIKGVAMVVLTENGVQNFALATDSYALTVVQGVMQRAAEAAAQIEQNLDAENGHG